MSGLNEFCKESALNFVAVFISSRKEGSYVLGNDNSDDPRVIVEFEILMVGRPWHAFH